MICPIQENVESLVRKVIFHPNLADKDPRKRVILFNSLSKSCEGTKWQVFQIGVTVRITESKKELKDNSVFRKLDSLVLVVRLRKIPVS